MLVDKLILSHFVSGYTSLTVKALHNLSDVFFLYLTVENDKKIDLWFSIPFGTYRGMCLKLFFF
jgi:hypothetical protein